MPLWLSDHVSSRLIGAVMLLAMLCLGTGPRANANDGSVIAPQATLTVQPDHGSCDQDVTFSGSGFVPGSSVVLRPIHSASGHPYPDGPVYDVTADASGRFTLQAAPCPDDPSIGDGLLILWSAEPPGRPYFVTDGPFSLTSFTVFDAQASRFFPETGHSISSEFRYSWEQNGGLPVFGYPLSEAFPEQNPDTDQVLTVQYFERQRFELHPENAGTPYDVLLGRLGAEDAEQRGIVGHGSFAPVSAGPSGAFLACAYLADTSHHVCNQFLGYWQSHGLELGDAGTSYRESVALFGYPLSEPFVDPETGILIQYFERAVFELHPENAGTPYEVLLRRLGADLLLGICTSISSPHSGIASGC